MRTSPMLMLICVLLSVCVYTYTAEAQIPNTFSYQGVLTDAAGTPVADGSRTLLFKLYDSPSASTAIWSESQTVAVRAGVFNAQIGSVQPLALGFDKPYYLGITIDGGNELLPRTALTAAPYALTSMRAETASALEPGAGGVVTSVNTLSGAITLEGGGATTVTRAGSKITISSTGGSGGTGIQGVQNTDGTMTVQNPNGPVATIGLADDGITAPKLQSGIVTGPKLAAGSVTKDKIAQNEVVKSLEVGGTMMRDDIVLEAGSNVTLTPNGNRVTISSTGGSGGTGIQGVQNTDGSITVQNPNGPTAVIAIADNAVGTTKIANSAVTGAKVASGQLVKSVKVGSVNLYDEVTFAAGNNVTLSPSGNTITIAAVGGTGGSGIQGVQSSNGTMDITNGTGPIATVNVANNGIGAAQLAANAVTTPKIADAAVTGAKLAPGLIPNTLPPSGPAGGDLSGTYPNPTIANGAVTAAKLAPGLIPNTLPPSGSAGGDLSGSYPNPTIAANAVGSAEIANAAVTSAKLADDAVTSAKIDDGTIATADLSNAAVTAAKISGAGATTGQVLSWDGSNVTWSTSASSGLTGSGAANRLALWNGTSALTSDANLVYSGGKFGIGAGAPTASLQIDGIDGVLAQGSWNSGTASSLGSGTRMHWYPRRAAFRAGRVTSSQWDDANIGGYSLAAGYNTTASGAYAVALGYGTIASAGNSTALGTSTTASNLYATAVGHSTLASGEYSTAMGMGTTASGSYSLACGKSSSASSGLSVVIGDQSTASGYGSFALGYQCTSSATGAIAMGNTSDATAAGATAIGLVAVASGENAFALGRFLTASGNYSTAMGSRVSTNGKTGAFYIGDASTTAVWNAGADNRFYARFTNGYYLYSQSNGTSGVYLNGGGASWSSMSDSTKKENHRRVDGEAMLSKFRTLRLDSWNYIGQDPATFRHYGPMAQEWFAAFGHDGIGTIGNDTTLASADVDGILCIAVQALEKRTAELRKTSAELEAKTSEVEEMKAQLAAQRVQMQTLLSRVSRLEDAMGTSTASPRTASSKQASLIDSKK